MPAAGFTRLLLVGAAIVGIASASTAQEQAAVEVIDRIVAVVDGEVITLGQLRRVLRSVDGEVEALGMPSCGADMLAADASGDPPATNGDAIAERRVLECMVDSLLMFQHVRRFPQLGMTQDELDAAYEAFVSRSGSRQAWEAQLDALELTPADVRYDLERQLLIDNYVNLRYRQIVEVRPSDVQRYYDDVFVPEMERQGQPTPPLESVEQMIRPILLEAEVNRRVDEWIAGLRRRADIVVYVW